MHDRIDEWKRVAGLKMDFDGCRNAIQVIIGRRNTADAVRKLRRLTQIPYRSALQEPAPNVQLSTLNPHSMPFRSVQFVRQDAKAL